VKCRQTSFYVAQDDLRTIVAAIADEVVPEFRTVPHFLGLTLVKADHGDRAEVIVTSFWDDGLDGSDDVSRRFVRRVHEITGSNPARRGFDVLYAEMRSADGATSHT
jgi:hypothetical protein